MRRLPALRVRWTRSKTRWVTPRARRAILPAAPRARCWTGVGMTVLELVCSVQPANTPRQTLNFVLSVHEVSTLFKAACPVRAPTAAEASIPARPGRAHQAPARIVPLAAIQTHMAQARPLPAEVAQVASIHPALDKQTAAIARLGNINH